MDKRFFNNNSLLQIKTFLSKRFGNIVPYRDKNLQHEKAAPLSTLLLLTTVTEATRIFVDIYNHWRYA